MKKTLDGVTRRRLIELFVGNSGPMTVPQLIAATGFIESAVRTALYRMMSTDGVVRSREKANDPMGYMMPLHGFLLQVIWKQDFRLQGD